MNKLPNHVAIIMDGNGRWATNRGLKRSKGHEEGFKTLKILAIHALKKGIKVLSVFAFSTENFKRSEEEVNFLMDLFVKKFKHESTFFKKNNIKVIFSGRKEPLKDDVLNSMENIKKETKNNDGVIFNICLNYGAQAEIVDATKTIANNIKKNKMSLEDINENAFFKYLYNDLPPIDLLIRTGGELRVSNFMLYQISYSEMYFTKIYFPDFNEDTFDKALKEFAKRDRRYGNVKK